ncbi:dTDP-4-dehydrorhamnose 3,5-epimerase family protein [candidate division WOR-3 bacterium]|nr:dTDP-4-dehydrorhamnose 3,5-epimerase family protein [candidate division WOR-3 bacterium]
MFRETAIRGAWLAEPKRYDDERGWLVETWREDWLDTPGLRPAAPAMSYVSITRPGVARGPHEHRDQTDYFAFLGPSTFKVFLWDNRPGSPTVGARLTFLLGAENPGLLLVPPGVVHAYKNIGTEDGLVLNYPNRLFAGRDKREPVDEIRHEDDPDSRFRLD